MRVCREGLKVRCGNRVSRSSREGLLRRVQVEGGDSNLRQGEEGVFPSKIERTSVESL